ncbi:MAG TPA: Fur family transcriptional regulator [Anaerolineae bacterium]|nr:Fur family transcriptional regulator [Anaerolineae bacterium]
MTHHHEVVDALQQIGYRLTPQRMMILEAIADSEGHLSAEEILETVRAAYPYLDISTVYRTLDLLKTLHLVSETDLGRGPAQYELLSKGLHHHLICTECREILDVPDSLLDSLRHAMSEEYDFHAEIEHLAVFGICSNCKGDIQKAG